MQDIIIKKDKENNGFEVIQGDKRTGTLGFDETLGLRNMRQLQFHQYHRILYCSSKSMALSEMLL